MKWYQIFSLPKYVTDLAKEQEEDYQAQIKINAVLLERIVDLEKQVSFLRDTIKGIEQVLQTTPIKNDIEEEDEGWDEVDENYRIPIVSGIRIAEEGQDIKKATPLNIYGFGETGVQPVKQNGSRQRKPKTN